MWVVIDRGGKCLYTMNIYVSVKSVHRLKLHLLLVPILFYTPNPNGAEWIGETSTCAGFIRRVRSHNIHSGDSSGGGEEQLNFLPFEMCAASER